MQKDIQKKRIKRVATKKNEVVAPSAQDASTAFQQYPPGAPGVAETVLPSLHQEIVDSSPPLSPRQSDGGVKQKRYFDASFAYRTIIFFAIIVLPYVVINIYQELHSRLAYNDVAKQVAKIAIVPAGEVPIVYDVDDPDTLVKDNPFFVGVKKNDKIIYYEKAGQVVVYDYAHKKIIAMVNTAFRK